MKILHRCWKYASHTVGNSRWFCRAVDSQILDDGITLFLDGLLWLLHCRRKIQGGQNPGKVLEQKIHFQGQIQMQHQKYPKSRNTGHYVWVATISVDLNKAGKLLHVSSPAWGRRISRKAGQHENPRKLPWPDKKCDFAILQQASAVSFLSGPNQWDTEVILLYQVHIHP